MTILHYVAILLLILAGLSYPANSNADTFPKCFIGTYLVEQETGTKSLWTFAARGTLAITSSAQQLLNFSTEHGAWEKSSRREAKATALDFSFGDEGELINIARVDATINFNGNSCDEIEGEFTLRFFEPDQDPLNPDGSSGSPITETLTGRRVTIK